jgi:hypothetical protein
MTAILIDLDNRELFDLYGCEDLPSSVREKLKPIVDRVYHETFNPETLSPVMYTCFLKGEAPHPYGDWGSWYLAEGSKGILRGLSISSL